MMYVEIDASNAMTIYAMIPARFGSERLVQKNLINIDGRPLLEYAINIAKDSEVFDRIYVNGDNEIFREIANKASVDYYSRPKELGAATATSDEVVYDFLNKHGPTVLCWVNSVSPLLDFNELKAGLLYFKEKDLDSIIASEIQVGHANFKDKPLNYIKDEKFARTQDLDQVELFCYSFMAWKAEVFKSCYREKGYGLMCGSFSTYPVSKLSAMKVKTIDDANIIDSLLKSKKTNSTLSYYKN